MKLYQPYTCPPGCHDLPFIYLFDGTALTNGADYIQQLSVKMDGDSDFILRRIAGVSSVAGFFAYRDESGRYAIDPMAAMQGPQADISVAPEKLYRRNAQIRFDLGTVAKAVAASGGTDFLSYIAFQGARRFPWEIPEDPCPWVPRSFRYVLNVPAVDWTRGQYKRFGVRIDQSYDFELQRISQQNGTNAPTVRTGVFNYYLYDPNRWPMMSAPVPDGLIVDQIGGILTTDPAPMPGVFPCPGMLYPRNSQILVDLYATESTPQGDCWQIVFDGWERVPERGPIYG